MNAYVPRINDINKLTCYHKKMIIGSVIRPEDNYIKKAERLRSLKIFEDDVKFQVLRESELVSNELYDCLYELYFGEPVKAEDKPETNVLTEPPENTEQTEQTEESSEPEPKEKRNYPQRLTDEQTLELINMYMSGVSNEELAERFGRTKEQIIQKLSDLKRRGKYTYMFSELEQKRDITEQNGDITEQNGDIPSVNDLPKTYRAKGRGYVTTEGRLRLDDTPITATLCKAMRDKGIMQTYAEVEIVVRITEPAGMTVTEE